MTRILIASDGTPSGTRILNADTGALVEGVVACTWQVDIRTGMCTATLTIVNVPVALAVPAAALTPESPPHGD